MSTTTFTVSQPVPRAMYGYAKLDSRCRHRTEAGSTPEAVQSLGVDGSPMSNGEKLPRRKTRAARDDDILLVLFSPQVLDGLSTSRWTAPYRLPQCSGWFARRAAA